MICPGPIRLCPAQNDQKGVRAHVVKFGSLLVRVFCRRSQGSGLINERRRTTTKICCVPTRAQMISCPRSFQNDLESFWNDLNHATLRRSVPRRPDLAGCLPRSSVRPDGRPSRGACKTGSDTGRTAHFRAVCAQRGALKPDARPWRRHLIVACHQSRSTT